MSAQDGQGESPEKFARAGEWLLEHRPLIVVSLLALFFAMAFVTQRLAVDRAEARAETYERALRVCRIRLLGIPASGWSEPPWDPPGTIRVINDVLGDEFRADVANAEQLAPGIKEQFTKVDRTLRVIRPDISHR